MIGEEVISSMLWYVSQWIAGFVELHLKFYDTYPFTIFESWWVLWWNSGVSFGYFGLSEVLGVLVSGPESVE